MTLSHGVGQDGKPLLVMPSYQTTQLSKSDSASIIAYCQQLSPVDNVVPENERGPLVNVLTFVGKMTLLPVEIIDHNKPIIAIADTSGSVAQGKYLVVSCTGYHQPNLKERAGGLRSVVGFGRTNYSVYESP